MKWSFRVVALAIAFTFFGSTAVMAEPGYYPSGPQRNVAVSTVTSGGWTLCYSGLMSADIANKQEIPDACQGDYVLYSGRATGSDTLLLLAAAQSVAAFTVTAVDATTLGNGTYWYFNDRSLGFAPNNTIIQNTADTSNLADSERFSLHTLPNQVIGGWRIGALVGLNDSVAYEKLIFTSNGSSPAVMPLTQTTPVSASVDKNIMTCSAGRYKVGMSEVSVDSVRYHLYVNNELMSTVVYDKGANIQESLKRNLPNKVSALVSAKDALFDLSGMISYSAYCVVEAYGFSSSVSSTTSVIHDSAYHATIKAKADAEEAARQAALVEFNSKENRELRKRLAARGIRG